MKIYSICPYCGFEVELNDNDINREFVVCPYPYCGNIYKIDTYATIKGTRLTFKQQKAILDNI